MQDPCTPPPQHVHTIIHHHPPAQVIGRIRRHGTHRIAQRLHALAGGCPAGPPLVIASGTLKALAPAVAFAGLTSLVSSVTAPDVQPEHALGGGDLGANAVGVAPNKLTHPTHRPINVPEPPSFTLLLLVTVGWMGIRLGLRRARPRA